MQIGFANAFAGLDSILAVTVVAIVDRLCAETFTIGFMLFLTLLGIVLLTNSSNFTGLALVYLFIGTILGTFKFLTHSMLLKALESNQADRIMALVNISLCLIIGKSTQKNIYDAFFV